ncbi:MAG: CrcB family protein [Bacteroidia bacterium]|nr:CrcB family protein [Bacteroidia bacterium]
MNFLLVFIGGGVGCVVRYIIGLGSLKMISSLPIGTFVSNMFACLIFAVTMWAINNKAVLSINNSESAATLKLLILTGFCGGLSTFSTFGYETFLMLKQGLYLYAFLNIIFSIIICLFIFYMFNRQET